MAPRITAALTNPQEHLTLAHKVNSRFYLNHCTESKSLLGPEFLKQQYEKTNILEMRRNLLTDFKKMQFSSEKNSQEVEFPHLNTTVQTSTSTTKDNSALWRPW
uniref:Uncharacterized protein n=1 Tax=Neolamprologus brichardi TaxID=32507 RepID=A0A3Q4MNH4_NEOBR